MSISRPLVVAAGGALGATCRWAIDTAVGPTEWPWVLLIVNIVGSFVLGIVLVVASTSARPLIRLGGGVGFCGGLTTFSSFAVVAVRLLEDDRTASAAAFVVASVVLAVVALIAGMRFRQQTVAP
jgi:CrcB protein